MNVAAIAALRAEAIEGRARLRVRGSSMGAALPEGAWATLRAGAPARIGDVVAFARAPHGVVVHRVVALLWTPRGPRLLTRGDAAQRIDAPVALDDIVGVVSHVNDTPFVVRMRDRLRACARAPRGVWARWRDA